MTLRFYNTATKSVDDFQPADQHIVTLYTCGPTVYDELTIGNWSAYVYWDVLVRVLAEDGYAVNRVMNITDVGHLVSDEDTGEDKLEKGAARDGVTAWSVAEKYLKSFIAGMDTLGLVPPTQLVRATDYIDAQLSLALRLKQASHTYQINDGIYFDTSTFPRYADFAGLDLTQQTASGRVTDISQKRQSSDFAIWKFSPPAGDEVKKRDMQWVTPTELIDGDETCKMGFPGWHLECSAIALGYLADTIDIHTGGIDHIPVHHTNEIAQSESATGVTFSRYWLHNNHLKVDGTKISKSLGNGYTLNDILRRGFIADDIRMFILQSHYRTEGNFSFDNLTAAHNRLKKWQDIACLRWQIHDTITSDEQKRDQADTIMLSHIARAIHEKLSDDLHTPSALVIIDAAFDNIIHQSIHLIDQYSFVDALEAIDQQLGFTLIRSTPDVTDEVKRLLIERRRVRESKDYLRSDELREELLAHGIHIRDESYGTVWSY